MSRPFDFIIFGATGYTGKYCVFQAPRLFDGYKWAVAGRNKNKLAEMLKEIGLECGVDLTSVPMIVADVEDYGSLLEMAKQCRVLINCCGPYIKFGEPVVSACVDAATDYVDVTAEPLFMEYMQQQYHEAARKQNVYSISACGFDSIPAEMGLAFAEENFQGTIHSSEVYITIRDDGPLLGASINYGTWESMVQVYGKNKRSDEIREQLSKVNVGFEFPQPQLETKSIRQSPVTRHWYIPSVDVDQRVSRRTQQFLNESSQRRPVQLIEYYDLGKTFILPVLAVCLFWILYILTRFRFFVKMMLAFPRLFSLGFVSKGNLSKRRYESTVFEYNFHNKGWATGTEITDKPTHETVTVVSGINPAYRVTCICLLLSAVTLITERDLIPGRCAESI